MRISGKYLLKICRFVTEISWKRLYEFKKKEINWNKTQLIPLKGKKKISKENMKKMYFNNNKQKDL